MSMKPLTNLQLEVLRWVDRGSPDGVYEGFSHRSIARSLHSRRLVTVKGRGPSWSATVTEDGRHLLDHGTFKALPAPTAAPRRVDGPARKMEPSAARSLASAPREPKPKKIGPMDQMMARLAEPGHRIDIERDEESRYKQLIAAARRFNRIPEGMRVQIHYDYNRDNRTSQWWVSLEPLPDWMTAALSPVRVPATLHGASDVVAKLKERDDLVETAAMKGRALRIAEGLVVELRHRGYRVEPVPPPRKNQWGWADRDERTTGHLLVFLDRDQYRLGIRQEFDRVEHVATASELARAGRGYAVPTHHDVPTDRLRITVGGKASGFWGSHWSDNAERTLESSLAQVIQELELRHQRENDRRDSEKRARDAKQIEWEAAKRSAIAKLTEDHRVATLEDEAANWVKAEQLREYVAAVRQRARRSGEDAVPSAVEEWAVWALKHADAIDPLGDPHEGIQDPPTITHEMLAPYMKPWSTYGPY